MERSGNQYMYLTLFISECLVGRTVKIVMDASTQTFAERAKFEEVAGIYQSLNSDLDTDIKRLIEQHLSEVNFLKEQLAKANDAKDVCQLQLTKILAKKTYLTNKIYFNIFELSS